jgi:hypothetical protein
LTKQWLTEHPAVKHLREVLESTNKDCVKLEHIVTKLKYFKYHTRFGHITTVCFSSRTPVKKPNTFKRKL